MSEGIGTGLIQGIVETPKETAVLDKGFVRLIDHMGNDERVVFAARRSTQGKSGSKRTDADLIDYLMREGHNSPNEHCIITLEMKMPIFIARQWFRHRTGSPSELSMRYSGEAPREYYIPAPERIRQAGSDGTIYEDSDWREWLIQVCKDSDVDYNWMIEHGMDTELARIALPVNLYTNFLWTMDLRNLLHLLKERLADGAQWEIREYAKAVLDYVRELFPLTVAAWENHVRYAITFSRDELIALRTILHYDITKDDDEYLTVKDWWLKSVDSERRERQLYKKLEKVNLL